MSDLLPLRVVVRRSGISADVLRAWERRYRAVEPLRTDTGRRMYRPEDVERLVLLRRLTLAGHSIGRVAPLPSEVLRHMASEDTRARENTRISGDTVGPELSHPVTIEACLDAIGKCDQARLNDLIARASLAMTPSQLIEQFLSPLMHRIGASWHDGRLRISEEHLATSTVRSFVGNMIQISAPPKLAPVIVVATPAGQQHEIGALFAAATAALAGWSPIFLGTNLPAQELAASVRTSGARAIALSLVFPADDPLLPAQLRQLRALLPSPFPILLGGHSAAAYAGAANEIQAPLVPDFAALRARLADVRNEPQRPPV